MVLVLIFSPWLATLLLDFALFVNFSLFLPFQKNTFPNTNYSATQVTVEKAGIVRMILIPKSE